jgi:cell fate regulator YaaT (PSP1 superfamily)
MPQVVAIKLRYNPKVFWFDPADATYQTGDQVLVDTERGREVGLVVDGALEVTDAQVSSLKGPLKPVVRALDDTDLDHMDVLDAKGREAMPVFREKIEKYGLDMKPVSVEYLFSADKAVFYFSSDERVDFRDLVRDLASSLHVRVDMRQIGVRDEARYVGGLAHCGEEYCCARLGGEFQPVSIRMAKEQDLPLNPAKISGACGRLMCCLRYEFEAYKDFKQRAPRRGEPVATPLGVAKVTDYNTPREIINLRLGDGKNLSVPLAEFEYGDPEPAEPSDAADKPAATPDSKPPRSRQGKGDSRGRNNGAPITCAQCRCRVSRDALDRCASSSILLALSALDRENERLEDREASPAAHSGHGQGGSGTGNGPAPRRRHRAGRGQGEGGAQAGGSEDKRAQGSQANAGGQEPRVEGSGQARRRRHRGGRGQGSGAGQASNSASANNNTSGAPSTAQQGHPRPGQRSSGVRNPEVAHEQQGGQRRRRSRGRGQGQQGQGGGQPRGNAGQGQAQGQAPQAHAPQPRRQHPAGGQHAQH